MSTENGSAEKLEELLDDIVALKNRGQYEQAIELVDGILEYEGNPIAKANAYGLRGGIKGEAGMLEAAIEDYDAAIEIRPENHQFHYQRGLTNVTRGEPEAAIEDFGAALDLEPEDVRLRQARAETRLAIGERESAFEDAKRAIAASEAPDDRAVSLLLTLAAGIALDEPVDEWEDEYRELCADGVDAGWDFDQLDAWLADADLTTEKASRIRSRIDQLR